MQFALNYWQKAHTEETVAIRRPGRLLHAATERAEEGGEQSAKSMRNTRQMWG
jgi:hypothetical protein